MTELFRIRKIVSNFRVVSGVQENNITNTAEKYRECK